MENENKSRENRDIYLFIFVILLVISVVFILYVAFHFKVKIYDKEGPNTCEEYREWTVYDKNGKEIGNYEDFPGAERNSEITIKTVLPEDMRYDTVMGFYTSHMNCTVYVEGEKIYEYANDEDNLFGKTSGYHLNMISSLYSYRGMEMTVEINSEYKMKVLPKFLIGSSLSVYHKTIAAGVPAFIISFVTLTVGITFCVVWFFFRRRETRIFLCLGIFSVITALYNINEQSVTKLFFENTMFMVYTATIMLMLLPIAFGLFLRELYQNVSGRLWNIFLSLTLLNGFVQIILQVFDICSMKDMLPITHLTFVMMFIVVFIQMVRENERYKKSKTIRINIISLMFVVFCLLLDVMRYYSSAGMVTGSYANIAFLAYILLVGINAVRENISLLEKGKQASVYEHMAYTDKLTGLSNRLGHDLALENAELDKHDYIVCMFDLDNLKKCNDTFGHIAGDEYISYSAHIIKTAFEKIAGDKIFRIGGDEFCLILEDKSIKDYEEAMEKLEKMCEEYNDRDGDVKIYIACGYARYDKELDATLKETRSRADAMMYENKFRYKQQRAKMIQS